MAIFDGNSGGGGGVKTISSSSRRPLTADVPHFLSTADYFGNHFNSVARSVHYFIEYTEKCNNNDSLLSYKLMPLLVSFLP
jgi:hypothetical protein